MADAFIDRELCVGDHRGGVLGVAYLGVSILRAVSHEDRQLELRHHLGRIERTTAKAGSDPLGGTIMLNESMISKSSGVGCLEKQPCTKSRVAAMLVARSSDAIRGRFLRLSPMKAGSALMLASTKLMPASLPAPWVVT